MKDTIVVNIFAGPGALKSGTASGVFTLLKLHNIDCELPYEFPKDAVWEDSSDMLKDQIFIFGNVFHRIFRLYGKVDVIVSDCPILLGLAYKSDFFGNEFENNVVTTSNKLNNLNFLLARDKNTPFENNGRNQSLPEAIELDNKIKKILDDNKQDYTILPSGHTTINTVTAIILEKLNRKIEYTIRR